MCGITGIYHYGTAAPADAALVRAMTAAIRHRGPDDDGYLTDGPLALGMRRLSIIDLEGGHQPISAAGGALSIIFNGEIYNYRELRAELAALGHRFATASDTEAALHAYQRWGMAGLARLNGMYGLAIWDAAARRLVLARDPFGIKPLYYHDDGRMLRFGSEIRAILADPTVPRAVDPVALDQFFALTFVPAPRTAFAGIRKLLPGHALVIESGRVRLERFYQVIPQLFTDRSEDGLVEELRERIRAAVTRQMVADVPVGVMLRGGVDSSTVAAIMTEVAAGPVKSFTVGFEGQFAGNELAAARDMARRLGAEHHEMVMSRAAFSAFLPDAARHMEEPVATPSTLPYYHVCALARRHVKVVLTGQGADEPFAGYARHFGERYGALYRALPAPLRAGVITPAAARLPRALRLKRAVQSLGEPDPATRLAGVYTAMDAPLRRRLYRDGLRVTDITEPVARWQKDVAGLDGLSQMLYVDARFSLADNLLLYGDKMAMAVSLEARVPFLDLELMAFVERIPPALKVRGRTGKHILRRAVSIWTPPEVLRRPKLGFETPLDGWLRGALQAEVRDRLLAPGAACREYLEPAVIARLLDEHRTGRHNHWRPLFNLLTFELWHDAWVRHPESA